MRFSHICLAAGPIKVLAASALFATSTVAGCTLSPAKAADTFTATTKPEAAFRCLFDDCSAGEARAIRNGQAVSAGANDLGNPIIGRRPRTVAIHCKEVISGSGASSFRVEVGEKNWTGLWLIAKSDMAQDIDGTAIPSC